MDFADAHHATPAPTRPDPAHAIAARRSPTLAAVFEPRRVAVIGASERPGSVGRSVMENLLAGDHRRTVYPVNAQRPRILDREAYNDVRALPEPVDLAVIATPAATVPTVIQQCAEAGVSAAIILSAGFREIGEAGVKLEQQTRDAAHAGRMRLIGPNCLGVMRPPTGLNATFADGIAETGNVAFISQSGALGTAILDWSRREKVGLSAFVSVGSMLDVGWGDLIDYFGDDPHTRSIAIYMESVDEARAFLSAAREVALSKPIVLLKAGRTDAAARAASSHTGALTGSDAVLDAACRRIGALRVRDIEELFLMVEVLSKQPRPRGPRLSILTNAGGPGVLATDALLDSGGTLAELSDDTRAALDAHLPPHWSRGNPIDVLGDADAARYEQAARLVTTDPNADGLLVVFTPQAMSAPTATAEAIGRAGQRAGKPVLASWMGGASVEAGRAALTEAGIPALPYPDVAARLFGYMWQYSYNLQGIYETPVAVEDNAPSLKRETAAELIDTVSHTERTLLTEAESKRLLGAYGLPVLDTYEATSADTAVQRAEQLGYPVVLKLLSHTITHKRAAGGVKLNLANAQAVRDAYHEIEQAMRHGPGITHFQGVSVQRMVAGSGLELILGSSIDAKFGPVLLFGTGGRLVEVMRDQALALPPLTTTLARRMMEQTRIYTALRGIGGQGDYNLDQLEKLLVRFSQLVIDQPRIAEIDINPLLATAEGYLALDARIVLHEPVDDPGMLPRPAIRPYPSQYVSQWTLPRGVTVTVRPIRPEDEPGIARFHELLSEDTVHQRFFHAMGLSVRAAHERLRRQCFNDYDREIALVVEHPADDGERRIMAVGRLTRQPGTREAEFALLVADAYQGQGVGSELLRRLVHVAATEGWSRVRGQILPSNRPMQRLCEKAGFTLWMDEREGVVQAVLDLHEQDALAARGEHT